MEENKKNIIKFEMSNWLKFYFYKSFIIGHCLAIMVAFLFLIYGFISKYNLIYTIQGILILSGGLSILNFSAIWKIRRARFATQLIIDKEKGEFFSYIYDIKKEVKFEVNDITEVNGCRRLVRFFLKDGTWVSWADDGINRQFLEEIIKSFGISIRDKKLW